MSEIGDWRAFLANNAPSATAPVPFWGWLLVEMLGLVLERQEEIMSAQDQVNADVATITAGLQSVSASQTTLAADLETVIADLKAQGVDTTALDAVAANATSGAQALADTVAQLDAAVNPAPAPAPEPPAGS